MAALTLTQKRLLSRIAMAAALLLAVPGGMSIGSGLFIEAKAIVAQYLLERAFAEGVASGRPVKPWRWADTWPMARLAIPRLHASVIVLSGGSGQALAFGPAHLDNTPLPGEAGASVIAAHRDTHFRFLGDLRAGDEIRVTLLNGKKTLFQVDRFVVAPWDESGIDPDADGRWLVLSTCWPLSSITPGPLRYMVYARIAEFENVLGRFARHRKSQIKL